MLFGHSSATSCDGFFYSSLMARDDIHVTLNDYHEAVAADGFLRIIQTKDEARFVEQDGFLGIEVLRHAFANDSSSKANDVACGVDKGDHHASTKHIATKTVEEASVV